MREATMEGGEASGLVQFDYAPMGDEVGTAYLRRSPEHQHWYWWVEGAVGFDEQYSVALSEMQEALKRRGVVVPELAEVGNPDSKVARYILGAACACIVGALIAFLVVLTGCSSCESGTVMKPAPQTHRWLGYPLEARISADLDLTHRASIYAALTWAEMRLEGPRRFNITVVPQDTLSVTGTPPYKVVEFSAELPYQPKEDVLAHTEINKLNGYATENGVFVAHSAQVRSYTASVSSYIHETFHILGLGHGTNTLMDVKHGRDQNGKGGDIDNMTLLEEELAPLRL